MNAPSPAKRPRDARLDFFRGLSLVAIFFAHIPGGWGREFIWARFGLSDAAHVFVFISGFAAALAFGGTFAKLGFAAGTARIAWRVAQLYACHLALFFLTAFLVATFHPEYAVYLGIDGFFADPVFRIAELFALRYVPTFFDILPLYMLVLACVPLAVALARVHPKAVLVLSAGVWLFVQATGFNLPAGEGRVWGFNPLAWQILFFAGFAFARGWIAPPVATRALLGVCFVVLVLGAAAEAPFVWSANPAFEALHAWVYAHADKPNLDARQLAHFAALAVVALWFVRARPEWLAAPLARPFVRLGRQALPVFLTGMALSHVAGMTMETMGRGPAMQILVHAAGLAGLLGVAAIARFVKNAPWKTVAMAAPVGAPNAAR
ncbi:MAG: OpgC domain-containing protein [Magnetospirillum sp.]|nr:OpgC domain-containing protein [Magnetospirillum sp.]